MKTTIETKQGKFTINSQYKGDKAAPWNDKNQNWNNHIVTVTHNKRKLSFDFWVSIMNPEIQNDKENISAFQCFVSDALSAKESFEYFCSEFGYDTDSRNAERIYKACEKALRKLERIFTGDIYDLANELSELENA